MSRTKPGIRARRAAQRRELREREWPGQAWGMFTMCSACGRDGDYCRGRTRESVKCYDCFVEAKPRRHRPRSLYPELLA